MTANVNFKKIWTWLAISALGLMIVRWAGYDSQQLQYLNLALNAALFVSSLPCSVFSVSVIVPATHFLDINPISAAGANLSTVLLLMLGALQWFWLANFWYPTEAPFQPLDLSGTKS